MADSNFNINKLTSTTNDHNTVSEEQETNLNQNNSETKHLDISDSNYQYSTQREVGAPIYGQGGDSFYIRIRANSDELNILNQEVSIAQDNIERSKSNNAAKACLDDANLTDAYFKIKDGFVANNTKYGKISLMGFRTPSGVNIPRLKIFDEDNNVLAMLSGFQAIQEIENRANIFSSSNDNYEKLDYIVEESENIISEDIQEYVT